MVAGPRDGAAGSVAKDRDRGRCVPQLERHQRQGRDLSMRILFAGLLALACAIAPATAQVLGSNAARVAALGLDRIDGDGVSLSYSDGAEAEARFYAREVEAAVKWYRETLDWSGSITMAVLNAADYRRTTLIPYPSPHAETRTRFIIIADHVETHPGFDLWDIDGRAINAAWTFHEMGHVIARDLGIASANLWVNELIASVIMAGYVRAERPQFAGFQSGMPPRFADAGHYETLAEFDQLYFDMGQFDYLWFHFHIARIADHMVSVPGGLSAVVDGLRREFPIEVGRGRETIAQTLVRLERIAPGVAELAAPLTGK
jgi:hypothetical protein